MLRRVVSAAVIAAALVSGCGVATEPVRGLFNVPDASNAGVGRIDTIKRVVDGDTVVLSNDVTVRILGIDTPETVAPGKPVECWGLEASAWAKKTLPVGKRVRLDFEPNSTNQTRKDRYDRLLAYVMYQPTNNSSWLNFSVETTRAGNARNYVYNSKPVSRQSDIAKAENEAKRAGRGLWNPPPGTKNCRG